MTQQVTLGQMRQTAPAEQVRMGFGSLQSFELMQRGAKLLATAQLVPKEYQGNLPNCVIALNMANRIGADPLMVMQNLVVVHGKPTWSSQFLIATVNTCGRFTALRYEFFGEEGTDSWGCRAWAIEKDSGEKLVGTDITIGIAKAEGWYGKNGSKWKTIPQQMLMYRAGAWWTRAYAPELSMGLQTAEEAADIIDIAPSGEVVGVTTETLRREMKNVTEEAEGLDVEPEAQHSGPPQPIIDPETGEVLNPEAIPDVAQGQLV
ncbi:hypothetical protein [Neisseria shayeganii]|uniref:Recombinase RecT n=1 Tax=Neisseria shayeganii TaxID=607712 RepID=A0A7D7RNU2_9NEIS|nr:hypothetical protein [Neisseria shayeganii]QMT41282.1 hypothetical protein H3L94_04445 [Neisseria shayeganii]